eukprot:COSAG05_NODE_1887_length_3886_cov_6.005545_7_plen_80_part_00
MYLQPRYERGGVTAERAASRVGVVVVLAEDDGQRVQAEALDLRKHVLVYPTRMPHGYSRGVQDRYEGRGREGDLSIVGV